VQAPAVVPVAVAAAPPIIPVRPDTATTGIVPSGEWQEAPRRRVGPIALLTVLLLAVLGGAAFLIPKLIGNSPDQVQVPSLVNLTKAAAESEIRTAGLTVGTVTEKADDTVAKGMVVSQDPTARAFVDPGETISFIVSTGKATVQIPNVIGDNKATAADQLRALGLTVRMKSQKSDEAKDNVVAVKPDVGTEVTVGTSVTILFSQGPQTVPNVVGETLGQATKDLDAAGFQVSMLPDSTSTEPKGTVTQMSPNAGTTQNAGTVITRLVSTYVAPTAPPTSPTSTPTATPPVL
jgi:serine/threonine-protein kinase